LETIDKGVEEEEVGLCRNGRDGATFPAVAVIDERLQG
jgi:hypothetical protein